MVVEEIVLVWNADAGLGGHLSYAIQKLRGIDECELCALTHGAVTEKPEWKTSKRDFGTPVLSVYRNRLNAELAIAANGEFPCVLARTSGGLVKLLGPESIDTCNGDLGAFLDTLRGAAESI